MMSCTSAKDESQSSKGREKEEIEGFWAYFGPDAGGETVLGAVGYLDGVRSSFGFDDGESWTEGLLEVDFHLRDERKIHQRKLETMERKMKRTNVGSDSRKDNGLNLRRVMVFQRNELIGQILSSLDERKRYPFSWCPH